MKKIRIPRPGTSTRSGDEIIHRVHHIEEDGHLFYLSSVLEDNRARVVLFLVLEQGVSFSVRGIRITVLSRYCISSHHTICYMLTIQKTTILR